MPQEKTQSGEVEDGQARGKDHHLAVLLVLFSVLLPTLGWELTMSIQNDEIDADQDDSEAVALDLDEHSDPRNLYAPESFFDKIKRCGNAPNSTPLPWPQISVVMLVSLSEGSSPYDYVLCRRFHSSQPILFPSNSLIRILCNVFYQV